MEGLQNILNDFYQKAAELSISEKQLGKILKAILVTHNKISKYGNIVAFISGGSDSDLVVDLLTRIDTEKKIRYVHVNPGLEYGATEEHIHMLEGKYQITIKVIRPKFSIPVTCKRHGQPFLSKRVSEMIHRLQIHHFHWEDEPFEVLMERYLGCQNALEWWCNKNGGGMFDISWNKDLKKFLMTYPPYFDISSRCCKDSKKEPIHNFLKESGCDLNIYGVRKSEGGVRSTSYKNCFTEKLDEPYDEFRPIFWLQKADKETYERLYDLEHSRCYSDYGLSRTGCTGCPYGKNLELELEAAKTYEPKMYKAVTKIFSDSYTYTRMYREFVSCGGISDSLYLEYCKNRKDYETGSIYN